MAPLIYYSDNQSLEASYQNWYQNRDNSAVTRMMKMTAFTKMLPHSTQVSQWPKQIPSCRNKMKQKPNTKQEKWQHPLPMMPCGPFFPNFILFSSLFKRVPVLNFALPPLLESHRIFELLFPESSWLRLIYCTCWLGTLMKMNTMP